MRGHVVAELRALMEATGYRRAVYLPANPSKGRIIRGGEYYTLPSIIAASASEGMLLMDDCLAELVNSGFVTQEDVARYASNPARMG